MDNNLIIEREKKFIDKISDINGYDSNIRHLLYIIIPAFIIKYGIKKEQLILDVFKNIIIFKSNKESEHVKAYYLSVPKYKNNKYISEKHMVIYNYDKISLIELLDTLVHEFNHAVNSFTNEIIEDDKYLLLRTGLSYKAYRKTDLSFIKKDSSFVLEEIINTKQTEDIINIIKSFDSNNSSISNTIFAINGETSHKYNSNSYFLQSYICKEILNNRTFISTLEELRITGEISEIEKWFDDIFGTAGKYKEFISLLNELYNLEIKYSKKKVFRFIILYKIKNTSINIKKIVDEFNNSITFK